MTTTHYPKLQDWNLAIRFSLAKYPSYQDTRWIGVSFPSSDATPVDYSISYYNMIGGIIIIFHFVFYKCIKIDKEFIRKIFFSSRIQGSILDTDIFYE